MKEITTNIIITLKSSQLNFGRRIKVNNLTSRNNTKKFSDYQLSNLIK